MDTKPGYQTTEFWLTLAAQLIPALVLFNIVTADQAQNLISAITQVVVAITAFVAAVTPIVNYIKSRTEIKLK